MVTDRHRQQQPSAGSDDALERMQSLDGQGRVLGLLIATHMLDRGDHHDEVELTELGKVEHVEVEHARLLLVLVHDRVALRSIVESTLPISRIRRPAYRSTMAWAIGTSTARSVSHDRLYG